MTKKLLIIDDEVGLTKTIGLVASRLSMDFKVLNSSATAVRTFSEYRPDIVIIDMIMPEMDGIGVLDGILKTGIPTQVIVTSGYGDSYLRLAAGVGKFHGDERIRVLRKPFRRQELEELLTSLSEAPPPSADGIAC